MGLTTVAHAQSFLSVFQEALKANLDKGILNGRGLNDTQKEIYEVELNTLYNCDLEFFKTYITNSVTVDCSIEYEVLHYICKNFHFNTNRNDCESVFKLLINTIFCTITEDNLEGVNILNAIYIQMLLESFPNTQFEQEILEILNHCLNHCKNQEFSESYHEFYDFKQTLRITQGNTVDCSNFKDVKTSYNPFYVSSDKASRFYVFLQKHYPGLEKFVTEL
jgi:hypothetical protein